MFIIQWFQFVWWPWKAPSGERSIKYMQLLPSFILDKIRVSCEVFIVHVGSHKILGKHRKPLNTLLFWRKTIRVRKYITLLFLLIAAVIHEHGLFLFLLDLAYFSGCFVCTLKQQAGSYEHMQLKLEKFKVDDWDELFKALLPSSPLLTPPLFSLLFTLLFNTALKF